MNGMITFTVAMDSLDSDTRANLDAEVGSLGFKTTVPCSEGGDMLLPLGTYACFLNIEDQHEQLKRYYRSLVDVMRKLEVKGKYFIGMANEPILNICEEL